MLPCAGRRAVRGRRHHGVLTPIPVSAARRPTSSLAHRSKLPAGGTGSPLLPTPSRGRSKTSDPVHSPTHGDERPHCGCRRGRCIWYSGAGGNHRGEAPLAQSVDAEGQRPDFVLSVTPRCIPRRLHPRHSRADALGIIVGNCGIQNPTTYAVVNNLATAAVVLSLPLLLFSTDLRQVRRKGLSVLFALFVGAVAVVASATACHFAFRSRLDQEAWKARFSSHTRPSRVACKSQPPDTAPLPQITALMTAVLIGGTPNMASVRTALGIDSELYVTVHTAEVVVGAVYVLLIMVRAAARRTPPRVAPSPCHPWPRGAPDGGQARALPRATALQARDRRGQGRPSARARASAGCHPLL